MSLCRSNIKRKIVRTRLHTHSRSWAWKTVISRVNSYTHPHFCTILVHLWEWNRFVVCRPGGMIIGPQRPYFEESGVCVNNGVWRLASTGSIFRHPVPIEQLFKASRVHHFLASSNSIILLLSIKTIKMPPIKRTWRTLTVCRVETKF